MTKVSIALLLVLGGVAHGADPTKLDTDFTEESKGQRQNTYFDAQRKATADLEARMLGQGSVIESARQTYTKFNNRVRVPGFISASPVPQVARIVGPNRLDTSFRMGDAIFLRWSGAPLPKPGDRFSTFTPAVVLQNLTNPTDFEVFDMPGPTTKIPPERRLAGYIYETTGRIKIVKVAGGLVNALVEQLSGRVGVGDEIMQTPPLLENITPINSGIQLSAAVVCGSPVDRLSTTKRSFLYLNRGSRDGIRVGRVFESIEAVKLDEAVGGAAPEVSNGEIIVVHVTDSYSTAMITKQFDVIRIGSLLRAKQEENPSLHNGPFEGYANDFRKEDNGGNMAKKTANPLGEPTIPTAEKLPGGGDESLPEPRKRPSGPPLSELDELEQSMKMKNLTPAEKNRLDKLSRQEKVGTNNAEEGEELADTPGGPTVENSFKDGKKAKKDAKKKSKSKNDEEELNLLMMQN